MQEYEQDIFSKYPIDVLHIKKVRGAVLCHAEQGTYLLKEVVGSENRVLAMDQLYQHLMKHTDIVLDGLCQTKEGELFVKGFDGKTYMLRHWQNGRECDIKKTPEILMAAGTLAKLHSVMHMEMPGIQEGKTLTLEYERHNRQLRKVRQFVRKATVKGEFELAFLATYDEMEELGEMALQMLKKSGYHKLLERQMQQNAITHGEYNYHNIWILEKERDVVGQNIAVTGFDKFRKEIQIEDLYYFLRKIMEKCGWKERLGDNILNAYSAVRPLSHEELEYLNIRLLYPEKFWKVANSFYNSNKAWTPSKNVEKLEIVRRQTKEKERFIQNIFSKEG